MKKFDNAKMVLFDSTNASFRLAVEAKFSTGNSDQGYRDLVYVSGKERLTANLNPNIYLTLSCKADDVTPVYTSYPQIYKLREVFNSVKNAIESEKAFTGSGTEAFTVSPNYTEPFVLEGIGKSNNWIAIQLKVLETGENGVIRKIPGVSIELSTSNRNVSTLTIDEFLTITTIINDINLIDLQCMMSLAYLDTDRMTMIPQQNIGYQTYGQQQYAPAPQQQYPQQYAQPRYNNYSRQRYPQQAPMPPRSQQAAPTIQQQNQQQFTNQYNPSYTTVNTTQYKQEQSTAPTSSNSSKNIMTLKAIEEAPVAITDFDDPQGYDDIFND